MKTAQAEPASPLAPGASPFVPSPSLSPSLPAPLPPPSGMPPLLSMEPAMGGAQAMFACLPGFAASMADRSPAHNPSLPPPPPPSPPTPAAYAAAAAVPLGSPSSAPSFNLADANSLLDAMKVWDTSGMCSKHGSSQHSRYGAAVCAARSLRSRPCSPSRSLAWMWGVAWRCCAT